MLAEVLQYLLTPCSGPARRDGYLAGAISLWSRAGRWDRVWREHDGKCQAVVAQAVESLPKRGTVLVVGSGLVRDVDLDFLEAKFGRVILADAVHLWPVRWRVLGRKKVLLAEVDLSREEAWAPWHGGIDLVISANVLSQLPLLPMERTGEGAAVLIRRHLELLQSLGCRVCLLTDTRRERRLKDGTVLESDDLLHGVALPSPERHWEWTVAPFGETGPDQEWVHRVAGYADFRLPGSLLAESMLR